MKDRDYMLRAIELARRGEGKVNPNPMVGAVIVKDGHIIGEGWHHKYGELHAERDALASLTEPAGGATIYVTLEPCCHYGKQPPCTLALIEHGISRVVIGSRDPNPKVAGKGVRMLREHGITVEEDFMRSECDALNSAFFHYITQGTPYVMMKYAMTADGKMATRTGASKWISGEAARQKGHEWRNACMGIMVGIGTVLADDPLLNCRIEGGKDPIRIICDTNLRIPEDSQIVKTAGEYETIVVCGLPGVPEGECGDTNAKTQRLKRAGITVLNFPQVPQSLEDDPDAALLEERARPKVSLTKLMKCLGERGIDSILLEGGGTLNESALRAGIVQEVKVFVAPKIFGGRAKTPVEGLGVEVPAQALEMKMESAEVVGDDLLISYKVRNPDTRRIRR